MEDGPIENGAVLGIDAGYSEHRASTCLCLLEWSKETVRLRFQKVGTDECLRSLALKSLVGNQQHLAAVAIDGPLTKGLRLVPHYRTADALLSRGVFQKRGKPGQTSSPIGQKLHQHATQLAQLVLLEVARGSFSIGQAAHIEPIDQTAIVEAFPNQFLAALIDEDKLPRLHRDASDRYWECLTSADGLNEFVWALLPSRRFEFRLEHIYDHDERAAAVCALTGLTLVNGDAVGVGDPEDGDIFLPPTRLWGTSTSSSRPWVEEALRHGVNLLKSAKKIHHVNHTNARVRLHRQYWIS